MRQVIGCVVLLGTAVAGSGCGDSPRAPMEPTFTDGSRLVAQSFSSPRTVPLFVGIYIAVRALRARLGRRPTEACVAYRRIPPRRRPRSAGLPGRRCLARRPATVCSATRCTAPTAGAFRTGCRAICTTPTPASLVPPSCSIRRATGRPAIACPATRASAASSPTPAVASRWRPRLTPPRSRCWRWPMTRLSSTLWAIP